MKFSLALLAAVSAESNAERRLAKIEDAAADFKNVADNHEPLTESRRARINELADQLMKNIRAIDTSVCPDEAGRDDLDVDMNFVELCEGSSDFPSMLRSYARKFGCEDGYPKRAFLKRFVARSHRLKRVTQKFAKCDKLETTETAQYRCDFVPGAIPVTGTIHLEERMINGVLGVHFYGTVESGDGGFTDGKHGFHVHSSGDPSNKCAGHGGHFASAADQIHGPYTAPLPDRHAGDLGNVVVNNGVAHIDIFDKIVSLDESSPEYVGNRGIVFHALEDDGNPERSPTSTGNAGPRLACCAITKD